MPEKRQKEFIGQLITDPFVLFGDGHTPLSFSEKDELWKQWPQIKDLVMENIVFSNHPYIILWPNQTNEQSVLSCILGSGIYGLDIRTLIERHTFVFDTSPLFHTEENRILMCRMASIGDCLAQTLTKVLFDEHFHYLIDFDHDFSKILTDPPNNLNEKQTSYFRISLAYMSLLTNDRKKAGNQFLKQSLDPILYTFGLFLCSDENTIKELNRRFNFFKVDKPIVAMHVAYCEAMMMPMENILHRTMWLLRGCCFQILEHCRCHSTGICTLGSLVELIRSNPFYDSKIENDSVVRPYMEKLHLKDLNIFDLCLIGVFKLECSHCRNVLKEICNEEILKNPVNLMEPNGYGELLTTILKQQPSEEKNKSLGYFYLNQGNFNDSISHFEKLDELQKARICMCLNGEPRFSSSPLLSSFIQSTQEKNYEEKHMSELYNIFKIIK